MPCAVHFDLGSPHWLGLVGARPVVAVIVRSSSPVTGARHSGCSGDSRLAGGPPLFLLEPSLPETEGPLGADAPGAPPVTRVLSASQGGVRDPAGGGRAPVLVGGKATLPLQPQDEALETLPAGAHGALRPAAAAGDGSALTAVSRAETGPV